MSIHDAELAFFKDKVRGFIVIPKDFERDLLMGRQVDVSVYGDSAYLIVYKTLYSAIVETAIGMGGRIEVCVRLARNEREANRTEARRQEVKGVP